MELWADPWKGNSPCFSWKDPFYFGRKYKDEFEYNFYQKKLNEGSYSAALGRGFEDLAEAKQFAESWKEKISKEHAEIIDGEKVLYNLLFR
nr:hypothetical protein [Mycobacterium sp. E3298]